MKIILSIILCFNTAWACPEQVQLIEKGTMANCTGFLFSPDAEKKAAQDHLDAKYYKTLSDELILRREKQMELNRVMDERLKNYMEQTETLAKELHRRDETDKWENVLYFGLGVLATGIAVYGASQLD